MSDGEQVTSDGEYAPESSAASSRSASTGRSSHRVSAAPSAGQEVQKRRNIQDIMNNDPGSAFPWDEILFYVPEWVPPIIARHVLRRILSAGGQVTEDVQQAHVVISYRGATQAQQKEVQRLPGVREKELFVQNPDWLARVYFSSRMVDPPRYLVWSNQHPLIAMSDLGSEDLNLKMAVNMERHGAIIVSLKHAQVLCVADDSPLLTMAEDEIPPQLGHVLFMPVSKFFSLRTWARKWYFKGKREAKLDRIEEKMRRAARQAARTKARLTKEAIRNAERVRASANQIRNAALDAQAEASRTRAREELTTRPRSIGNNADAWQTRLSEAERRLLGIWIAYHCPDGKGRTSATLYDALVKHQFEDKGWAQLARGRSASAWRDWYRKFYKLPFPDGRSFGTMIEDWVDEIDDTGLDDALGPCKVSTGDAAGTAPRKRLSSAAFVPTKRPRKLETPAVARARGRETPAAKSTRETRAATRTREMSALGRVGPRRAATETPSHKRRQLVVEIPRRRSMRPA